MKKWYTLESCNNLMKKYYAKGGNCVTVCGGSLGLTTAN